MSTSMIALACAIKALALGLLFSLGLKKEIRFMISENDKPSIKLLYKQNPIKVALVASKATLDILPPIMLYCAGFPALQLLGISAISILRVLRISNNRIVEA